MPVTNNPAAEAAFYASIANAPVPARMFFDQLAKHFQKRDDSSVAYTFANNRKGQMRIWAFWGKANGKEGKRVTATLHWQSRKQTVFVRCLLTPLEIKRHGFHAVDEPKGEEEALKCDLFLHERDWSHRTGDVIAALDASANKAGR